MAIYLEIPRLDESFPFRTLYNDGDILTTPHWHKELEIIYVKKGVIRMGIGDEVLEVCEGEFVLVAGGRVHYVLASPGSIRYVYQFDEKFFRDLTEDKFELESLRNLWRDYPSHSREWRETMASSTRVLLDAIYEEDQSRKHAYIFALKGYMCLMVLGLYRNKEYVRNDRKYEYYVDTNQTLDRLDRIFRYVEKNYTEAITLKDVSDYIGFSTYYFTKFFKRNTGKTFIQFLNEYRIEKAKWILLNEDIAVAELVERIGIGSIKTYYRLFKEIVGMSPKEYKRKR